MAVPFGLWPGMGFVPHSISYAIPEIPPSANPLVVDRAGAIRDFTEHATNGDRKQMCTVWDQKCLEDWAKDEGHRKVIFEVLKSRLDLGWPYNYKALDLLSLMGAGELLSIIDKLKALSESPTSTEGAAELKKLSKPLFDKADGEKKKGEAEEAKKKQEAIAAMWGGIWADDLVKPTAGLAAAGYYGWQYPYQTVPGVPAQAQVEWKGNPPNGWQPSSITPVPQVYPFSRAGYYALLPADHAPPDAPKAGVYTISVAAGGGATGGASKSMPLGLDQLAGMWEAQRQIRGW